jgi:hypothetical protein
MYLQQLTVFGPNFAPFYFFNLILSGQIPDMVAYEFYWRDGKGKEHFIGILPERRKNPERITKGSVLNWGWKVIGDNSEVKHVYFVKVNV